MNTRLLKMRAFIQDLYGWNTESVDEVIRMISARLATASEKERYEYGEDDDE